MQRLSQAVDWIGAELHGADAAISGAAIDTRQLLAGQLFVALPGTRVDGHDFVRKAAALGAGGALVSKVVDCALPQLLVPDVLAALQQLAARWRVLWGELSGGRIAGITGSNGKTSVKTLLAAMLSRQFQVFATPGNLNNHIGVPLCLLNLRPEHQHGVIEMGASHAGEIAQLAAWAQPDVGLVTNAGDAHLEGFGSRDGVARAKSEIFAALPAGGTAVINADDVYAKQWQGQNKAESAVLFGRNEVAQVRALQENNQPAQQDFYLSLNGEKQPVSLHLPGRHSVMNALAAAAAAQILGADIDNIAQAINQIQPVGGRLQASQLASGVSLINDAYNANPASMAAAIEVLAGQPAPRHLVIGDMAELGATAHAAHHQVGVLAAQHDIDGLWTCGPLSQHAAQAFGPAAQHFDEALTLAAALSAQLGERGTVLVKGSRSAAMERVVQHLEDNS